MWGSTPQPRSPEAHPGGDAQARFVLPWMASALPERRREHELWLGTPLGSAAAAAYLARRHPRLARHIEREHLTPTTRREVESARAGETAGWLAARAAAERFPASALVSLAAEKLERMQGLRELALGLDLPGASEAGARPAWQAVTAEESLRAALAWERETVALYDRFLAAVPELRIRDVFLRLRMRSRDATIPALERALPPSTPPV
jgi:hypothetical protein